MGFRFRKSVKLGPLRVNFSKSGVGYSVGGKGFRVTKKANGGVRTTASIPGTGISYVNDFSTKSANPGPTSRTKKEAVKMDNTPQKPKPPKRKKWPYIVGAILVMGAIGNVIDSDDAPIESPSSPPASAVVTVSPTPEVPPTQMPSDAPQETEAPVSATPTPTAQQPENPAVQPTPQSPDPAPVATAQPTQGVTGPVSSTGTLVGSLQSNKYHRPSCRHAKKIEPENEIWFSSVEDAKAHGYVPCGTCSK